ncbi:capsular polysaccharide biosynthesis protein [Bordetella ansorpii]|uniref:UDP-glucose 4-epimerase n=1 Tax=Bordetella ansorpii TaxID=288768 RepID=A0A157R1M2_9BORD|nr:UDP-glucose 4-epimerase GalE [Bordetella ansorpii]SAI51766.1 capsular polysaccharide biosynthesis protein [Bordetella ansorpii]
MASTLLVTGGAGYIGTHTLVALIGQGYRPVVLDNFSNSSPVALQRVQALTGHAVDLVQGDVRDRATLDGVLARCRDMGQPVQGVLHFAASKAVGESVRNPLAYYDNNVMGTVRLLEAMLAGGVKRFVFSSSATIYGQADQLPYTEAHPVGPCNPYGWSKAMVEQVMRDVCAAHPDFSAIALRYFNPIGAHESGTLGEDPADEPNNLFPYITQVAIGARPHLRVFGDDYATPDGTGVRDYLHVCDLAEGHVKAVQYQEQSGRQGFQAFNLGTGRGSSVLDLVRAFERVNGVSVPYVVTERRAGDIAEAWADVSEAERELRWVARYDLDRMCRDGWRWQSQNPNGYRDAGAQRADARVAG